MILDRHAIYTKLKSAIYEVLHRSKKSIVTIAKETGIGANHLERSTLHKPQGCNFQLEWIPLVTASTGNYLILDTLEQYVGRVGIPLPPSSGASAADICRQSMRAMKEFGELIAVIEKGLKKDDRIDPDESARIQREGYQALQAILMLMESCKPENID